MQPLRFRRGLLVGLLAALGGVVSAETAPGGASDFPNRAVRIVVPFPAGGNSDIIARTLATKLSQIWSQPVIVDNKPGGDTLIGTSDVVRAPADGYTILSNISLIVQNSVTKKQPFDTFKELRPLIAATETAMYFVAGTQSEAAPKTLTEFVQQAKGRPGALSFGSFGTGSTGHLLLLTLQRTPRSM
jgi:tripartite-type tricarboxylate transporter receptor subunit TctC